MAPKTNITKSELLALTEAISKYAVGEEKTAEALITISAQLEKIVARIYNGMTKEFAEEVQSHCSSCKDLLSKDVSNNKSILITIDGKLDTVKDRVFWINIIFGSTAAIIAISLAVSQVIHWMSHMPKTS